LLNRHAFWQTHTRIGRVQDIDHGTWTTPLQHPSIKLASGRGATGCEIVTAGL
jgi:hypothetical protein